MAEYRLSMSEHTTQLGQLLIVKKEGRTTVHLFSSHPTPLEEKNLGTVFGLFEIDATDGLQQEIVEGLAREVVDSFYHAEQFNPDRALEQSLQHVNQKIQTILPEVGEDWVKQFAGVVAVIHGTDVHFAAVGRLAAFIIQNNQIIDLHQAGAQPPQPLKVFSNLLSGKLNPQSTLFFSTETILDFLSKEKLKRTITNIAPDTAVEQLTQLLADDTTNTNFAAFILKVQPMASLSDANAIPLVQADQTRQDSMYDLVHKERTTTDLLSPSLWQTLKRSTGQAVKDWRGAGSVESKPISAQAEDDDDALGLHPTTTRTNRPLSRGTGSGAGYGILQKILRGLKLFGQALGKGILMAASWVLQLFRKGNGGRTPRPSVSARTTNWVTRLVVWFKGISASRKILLVSGIVVLFIVAQTIVSKGRNMDSQETAQGYDQTIEQIDVKINEARAALLYNNEDTARTALVDAQNLLAGIPSDSKIYEEKGQSRATSIQEQMNALNHIATVDSPEVVGDFSTIHPSLQVKNLVQLGASLFTFDAATASAYRYSTEEKTASVIMSSTETTPFTSAHKASPGTALVSINNKRVGLLNPVAGKVDDVTLEFGNKDRNIVDAETFGTRIYALDAAAGNIIRFQQSGDTYGEGTQWLTDTSVSLIGAKDMAIDGSIYVLGLNGVITKFFGGKPASDFSVTALSPGLEGATQLMTDENSNHIYVLDPTSKRVVILDKTGKLVQQITSAAFDNLRGIVVSETDKTIHVLNGTKILKVSIP